MQFCMPVRKPHSDYCATTLAAGERLRAEKSGNDIVSEKHCGTETVPKRDTAILPGARGTTDSRRSRCSRSKSVVPRAPYELHRLPKYYLPFCIYAYWRGNCTMTNFVSFSDPAWCSLRSHQRWDAVRKHRANK